MAESKAFPARDRLGWISFLSSLCALGVLCGESLFANPPVASYVFPAGGQRGTTVKVRVGGLFLYRSCGFELLGPGVEASKRLESTKTVWFEGPLLPLPESQQAEDYPRDMAGTVRIAADASLGPRRGRVWTAEGAASGLTFVVGDLPEVVEEEIDGDPFPVSVQLPVTINGRIFPRQDVDIWSFDAKKGQTITCSVAAARIGSPLDAQLRILDPEARIVAESAARGKDPVLHFTAEVEGKYQVRIQDANLSGSQAHVYRLTVRTGPHVEQVYPLGGRRGSTARFTLAGGSVPSKPVEAALPATGPGDYWHRFSVDGGLTNRVLLDLDDLLEHLEAEPNDTPDSSRRVALPAVVNGRVDRAGDVDCWSFSARKGEKVEIQVRARQLGSPLMPVLTVVDAAGKDLARAGDGSSDPVLTFSAPVDGTYTVRIADRFRSRGGPAFAYRLRMAPSPAPDFRLRLAVDALTLLRGGNVPLRVIVERRGGFADPISLTLEGLPEGVKVTGTTVAAGQPGVDVHLNAGKTVALGAHHITVRGTARISGSPVTRTATLAVPRGAVETDSVLLGVALPVPFKVVGAFDLRLAPRGSIFRRRYKIERNGFAGPLQVSLADRQMRHLQGVKAGTVVVPAAANEFEYAVELPPWMETGRTSRSCVMAVGVIEEGGVQHEVSYTSVGQNDQVIAVVETGRLGLDLEKSSVAATPGKDVSVAVRVSRGKDLTGPVKVELVVPDHVRGVRMDALTIPADRSEGACTIRFARTMGPFNVPLVLRATLTGSAGPAVAEAKLEVVAER